VGVDRTADREALRLAWSNVLACTSTLASSGDLRASIALMRAALYLAYVCRFACATLELEDFRQALLLADLPVPQGTIGKGKHEI